MKYSAVIIPALATMVTAQNFAGEPACATPCLSSAISVAGCAPNDTGCQCGDAGKAAIQSAGAACLIQNCPQTDLVVALSVGLALCSAFSATATGLTSATGTSSFVLSSIPSSTTVTSTTTGTSTGTHTTATSTGTITTSATLKTGSTGSSSVSAASSTSSAGANGGFAGVEMGALFGGLVIGGAAVFGA